MFDGCPRIATTSLSDWPTAMLAPDPGVPGDAAMPGFEAGRRLGAATAGGGGATASAADTCTSLTSPSVKITFPDGYSYSFFTPPRKDTFSGCPRIATTSLSGWPVRMVASNPLFRDGSGAAGPGSGRTSASSGILERSEERRVGKEC